jgi:preprotein translocase subunit YajC
MNFFINSAHAAESDGSGFMGLLFPILLLAVFYFVFIRPQQKKAKEHTALLGALKKSDEIVTAGGLVGKITAIDENFIEIEVATSIVVKVQKQAVANVLPKGSLKTTSKTTSKKKPANKK